MATVEGEKAYRDQSEYERAINALIPFAVEEAKAECRRTGKFKEKRYNKGTDAFHSSYFQYCYESEYFHKAMNRLAFEAGLRSFQ